MGKDLYIVSDVHGNYESLRKALYSADLFDNHGQKDPRAYIVQIGDNANCVEDSIEDDLRCLGLVGNEIDVMLIGNHEIPYFDPQNRFSGFYFSSQIEEKLHKLHAEGHLWPCYVWNDTLITHAGLTRSQLNFGTGTTAFEASSFIEKKWIEKQYGHYLFRDVGKARYGPNAVGGILWCDFDKEFEPTDFPQIVGHTPGILREKGNAICIDTGAKRGGEPTVLRLEE